MYRLFIPTLLFLALPLTAAPKEEALPGTWEGALYDSTGVEEIAATRLVFRPDGTFDVAILIFGNAFAATSEIPETPEIPEKYEGEIPEALLEELVEIRRLQTLEEISAWGTYETRKDSLLVHYDGTEYRLSGGEILTSGEFWAPIFSFILRFIAVGFILLGEEINPDELPPEQKDEVLTGALIQTYEEIPAEVLQESVSEMIPEIEQAGLGVLMELRGIYAIEGDTLQITSSVLDKSPESYELKRADVATAVVQATWGAIKGSHRR